MVGTHRKSSGEIEDVLWHGPAFQAGVAPGMDLVAVDGRDFSPEALKAAIEAAAKGSKPIELLVEDQDVYRTFDVDYHGGLRYPHLERQAGKPALLDGIVAPRK